VRAPGGRRAVGGVMLGALLAVALATAQRGDSQALVPPVLPLPVLGAADAEMTLMGAAPAGAPGEAWGYRELPLAVGQVQAGGHVLPMGAPADPSDPDPQLAFVRHTDATGWQVFDTPLDEAGRPYRGPVPNRLSARITPRGGGVLVGRDPNRPVEAQVVVLHHDPGGRWRALASPPSDVLLPADGVRPAESLAGDQGSGAIAVAALDEDEHTGLLFAPVGRAVTDGVIHFDGEGWTREPVEVPSGSENDFTIFALDATSPGNAWALARADPSLGRSVVLLQRTLTAGGPRWVERDLGQTPFAARDAPAQAIATVEPAGGAAQPLTVTEDGAWIDLRAMLEGRLANATLFYDIGVGRVTGSWCDAGACAAPLGADLSRQGGYLSFAWAGSGFGTRVITNPLDPGGAEDTNRGTYLRLAGGTFVRMPGGGANFRPTGAFASAERGWLEGPVEISARQGPQPPSTWPLSLRAPLTDVTGAPGAPAGALSSAALAVGADGSVVRYDPARGWVREFLLSSGGGVNKATLRGVAWPEPERAHAVGDFGAMWQWNADDGLWVADPGAPIGFEGHLMDVAFDPADPSRGYAVGRRGVLLRYDKSWEQEPLPSGFESADLTSIAFAGSQAIVAAGGDLLVNDGSGWRVDSSARQLLDPVRAGNPRLFAVAALPDGGAVAAGADIVIERDGPSSPWRFSNQPLPGSTVVSAAAIRSQEPGAPVRAVVSVVPQLTYPPADDLPEPDPEVPPPILPPFPLPGDGYLLRETADGWQDEQRTAFGGSGSDRPLKSDPVLALLLDPGGDGWAVGGWSGHADAAGRGSSANNSTGRTIRNRVRTAAITRFGSGAGAAPTAAGFDPVPMPAGPVRLAVAGHAQCETTCADLAPYSIGPDRTLAATLARVGGLVGGDGPRALLYTGNRVRTGLGRADAERYAALLGSQPGLPVFPALGSNDAGDGDGASAYSAAFAGFPGPFGSGPMPAGISTAGIPGAAPGPGARTHYAFDSHGPGGTVRVVVIDNSLGSLAASDPHQNPPEPQLPWLQSVLADARGRGIPVVVMGSRSLNPNFTPPLNVASDGAEVARALVEGGASVYLFDRPEENRFMRIPAGGSTTIPSYGVGTAGYRSPISGAVGLTVPDALFGDAGVLVLEVDARNTDPNSNRAPVGARLIPVISDLSLEATDGNILRRSRPALFRGLGRRPLAGDRWGRTAAGSGNPDPSGGDPYTPFPPEQCFVAGCSARITPEYRFTSSDPDLADFVRQDPASTNPRKPFLDENGRVVTDHSSGLLCAFNAGTATLTVSAGGFSYSDRVRVLDGSVQRPCGTRPLDPSRFPPARDPSAAPPAPPPGPQPANNPAPVSPPPPPPAAPPPPPAAPPPPPPPAAPPSPPSPPPPSPPSPPPPPPPVLPPQSPTLAAAVPVIVPPPPPPVVRPLPPGGAPARVYQVEERREEEVAPEESQAFSRREAVGERSSPPYYLLALVLIAVLAGASVRGRPDARRRTRAAPAFNSADRTRRSRP
jgi:hypothetical protein